MELALYHPEHGYYERRADRIGRAGDFYTSVSVGRLFGELLAFQFAEWASESGGGRFQIVEAGAHDARLAADILGWLRSERPEPFAALEYGIVEPSLRRRAWQGTTLGSLAEKVRWVADLDDFAPGGVRGVIFANELLDAFPVHRLGWDARAGRWFEWGVGVEGERLAWTRLPELVASLPPGVPDAAALQAVLPDGFTVVACPQAAQWWRRAAGALEHGRLLTFDYGLTAEECFAPQRTAGSLRAFSRHCVSGDVLADPGEQDLTAHVNFTTLQQAGEAAGLRTVGLVSQGQFLVEVVRRIESAGAGGFWKPERTRQLGTLVHPQHLGRAFRVLVQERKAGAGDDSLRVAPAARRTATRS